MRILFFLKCMHLHGSLRSPSVSPATYAAAASGAAALLSARCPRPGRPHWRTVLKPVVKQELIWRTKQQSSLKIRIRCYKKKNGGCVLLLASSCYLLLVDLRNPTQKMETFFSVLGVVESWVVNSNFWTVSLQKGGQLRRKTVILGESKSFKLYVFEAKVTSKAEKCIISSNLHANGQ